MGHHAGQAINAINDVVGIRQAGNTDDGEYH